MHANGRGVTQNFAEARKWFQLAADHGEVKAQSYLGALYATGRGVPQSYPEAAKWSVSPPNAEMQAPDPSLNESARCRRGKVRNPKGWKSGARGLPSHRHSAPRAGLLPVLVADNRAAHLRIGPAPSAGFHMMTAHHFGRR